MLALLFWFSGPRLNAHWQQHEADDDDVMRQMNVNSATACDGEEAAPESNLGFSRYFFGRSLGWRGWFMRELQ